MEKGTGEKKTNYSFELHFMDVNRTKTTTTKKE